MVSNTKIKTKKDIQASLKRLAYQVYESNFEENELLIVGIQTAGNQLAALLIEELRAISPLTLTHVTLTLDKKNPRNSIQCTTPSSSFENQSIVIVDDVLNTGSTLIYAVNYFLQFPVKQIKTAVMVNRNHKKFPVKADFKGISLSTSTNEHVTVVLEGDESGIYLS